MGVEEEEEEEVGEVVDRAQLKKQQEHRLPPVYIQKEAEDEARKIRVVDHCPSQPKKFGIK